MSIAKIRLAPGNAGWYDELTNIHITISNPVGVVRAGMNTANIKRGLAYGTILLMEGAIEEEAVIKQLEQTHNEVVQTSTTQVALQEAVEEPVSQEVRAEQEGTVDTVQEVKVAKEVKTKKSKSKAKAK